MGKSIGEIKTLCTVAERQGTLGEKFARLTKRYASKPTTSCWEIPKYDDHLASSFITKNGAGVTNHDIMLYKDRLEHSALFGDNKLFKDFGLRLSLNTHSLNPKPGFEHGSRTLVFCKDVSNLVPGIKSKCTISPSGGCIFSDLTLDESMELFKALKKQV